LPFFVSSVGEDWHEDCTDEDADTDIEEEDEEDGAVSLPLLLP
jgi:hypothetical protein